MIQRWQQLAHTSLTVFPGFFYQLTDERKTAKLNEKRKLFYTGKVELRVFLSGHSSRGDKDY